jgi:hypothetical protein
MIRDGLSPASPERRHSATVFRTDNAHKRLRAFFRGLSVHWGMAEVTDTRNRRDPFLKVGGLTDTISPKWSKLTISARLEDATSGK